MFFLALLAVVIGVTAATATGGARVVGNCTHSQIKPASIILACADANAALTRIHWSSFGGSVAHGSAEYTFNDCKPYCAAGKVHSYPVSLILSDPRRCPDGHRDYRIAVVDYSGASRPAGSAGGPGKPGKLSLYCPLKG